MNLEITIFIAATFLILSQVSNIRRFRKRFAFELQPNCLLTQNPIVFVSGKKSIFYYLKFWNFLPDLLAEHGYEVFNLDLAWRHGQKRITELKQLLRLAEKQGQRLHLIFDASSREEVRTLFRSEHFSSVASCTIIGTEGAVTGKESLLPLQNQVRELELAANTNTLKSAPIFWKLHRRWIGQPHLAAVNVGLADKNARPLISVKILDLAIGLAEMDFISTQKERNNHQGTQHHGEYERRSPRD